jgi:acyl carrier protein
MHDEAEDTLTHRVAMDRNGRLSVRTAVAERVLAILATSVPGAIARGVVLPDDELRNDLALNSLDLMSLAFRLEDEFGIRLSQRVDELIQAVFVDDLIDLVCACLGG